jgi:hypothetical protein
MTTKQLETIRQELSTIKIAYSRIESILGATSAPKKIKNNLDIAKIKSFVRPKISLQK